MTYGFEPSLDFLSQHVPLWFALLCAFTSPYLWARYAKNGVHQIATKIFNLDTDRNT